VILYFAVMIQYRHVTDRQTHIQTQQQHTLHSKMAVIGYFKIVFHHKFNNKKQIKLIISLTITVNENSAIIALNY